MPFPFKIRRLYSFSSKNSFLVRVRLLDNTVIECTQPVESTGQECLETVGQKLQLTETQYFGLWFQSKSQFQRWVVLEKALKKQLDKFATDHLLYFGVMFYMPSVLSLEQEVTRYQYYLQVKKEILEGRLRCSFEQGIRLAGLAVQADFGDVSQFESQDFLQEYALFPVGWTCADKEVLEKWTQKVAEEHKRLCGMTAAAAELLYIRDVEKLDNFGEESIPAKDGYANDVYLGASFIGLFVRHRNGRPIVLHRWNDVGNITHSRSTVTVEILSKGNTIAFQTDDMETAKYIARLLTSKHKFYKQNISAKFECSPVSIERRTTWSGSTTTRPPSYILKSLPAQYGEQDQQSSQDIPQEGPYYLSEMSPDQSSMEYSFLNCLAHRGSVCNTPSTSPLSRLQAVVQASPVSSNISIPGSNDIMQLDYSRSAIIAPSYQPTPDYEMAVRQSSLNLSSSFANRQQAALVYSQPEMLEQSSRLPGPWGSQMRYSMPATTTPFTHSSGPTNKPTGIIAHTVSTPELTGEQPGAAGYSTAHMLKSPPLPYPVFRPTASTPDLAAPPYGCPRSSSLELGARRVRQSVGRFQPESSVIRHAFQQTEPLTRAALGEHSSLEAMSSMVRNIEAMALRSLSASTVRRNTLREEVCPSSPQHTRSLSDAAVLIRSSESEKEIEETPVLCHQTQSFNQCSISPQLQAALASISNRPPPVYAAPRGMAHPGLPQAAEVAPASLKGKAQSQDSTVACAQQYQLSGSMLAPSVSEPVLTRVKEKVKVVKERPSSEMFSAADSFVEREIMQRKKQEMEKDSPRRLIWTFGQNRPYTARPPILESQPHGPFGHHNIEQCKLLEWKLAEEEQVAAEFVQIPWKANDRIAAAAALLPSSTEGNQLPDVVPYEENRVMLMPTKENHTGYINASHIKVSNAGQEWHYIAAQGPLPNTFQDFWQMVWEQGVNIIAMVTAEEVPRTSAMALLQEGSRPQSKRYWPQLKQSLTIHGCFKVTTKFCTDFGCYTTTGLTVKNLISGQERPLWHLQYTEWASNGCPEDPQDFLSYLEEIRSVRHDANRVLGTSRSQTPPVVVHCSTGAGQTGIVILTELIISALEQSQNINIPVMLARLRQQRMLMVQTFMQYKFVYKVLIYFLKNSRLI